MGRLSESPQPLSQVLRQRVALGPVALPAWSLLAVALLGSFLVAHAWQRHVPQHADSAPATSLPSANTAAPQAPGSATPTTVTSSAASTLERARSGDLDAIKQLDSKRVADRSIEECVAISEGHAVLARRGVEQLGRDFRQNHALVTDPTALALLFRDASDPLAAPVALPIAATLPGSIGPDLLYDVWTRAGHAPTESLAEDLLKVRSVREKAAAPLDVLLELEAETHCDRARKLVEKLGEVGDRRALPRLKQLAKKTGCGIKRADDCYPCLHGDELLRSTYETVKQRKPLRPWYIRRR